MTAKERKVLEVLKTEGPQWNGSLGVATGLTFNSRVFAQLERDGLIIGGNPMQITDAGRAALDQR